MSTVQYLCVQYGTCVYSTVPVCTVHYLCVQYSIFVYSTVPVCIVQYLCVQYSTCVYSPPMLKSTDAFSNATVRWELGTPVRLSYLQYTEYDKCSKE